MNICLIGTDGVGKTTHAKNIQKYLESKGRRVVYFHPGRFRRSLLIPFILLYNSILSRDVICDRSYYDSIIELYPQRLVKYQRLTAFLINAILSILPKFNLTLLLTAPFEEVSKRKNEITLRLYKKRMKLYNLMAKKLRIKMINTEKNLEKVKKELLSIVEKFMG